MRVQKHKRSSGQLVAELSPDGGACEPAVPAPASGNVGSLAQPEVPATSLLEHRPLEQKGCHFDIRLVEVVTDTVKLVIRQIPPHIRRLLALLALLEPQQVRIER